MIKFIKYVHIKASNFLSYSSHIASMGKSQTRRAVKAVAEVGSSFILDTFN